MGIKQFVLAINKIDLVNYDKARFDELSLEFREIALSLGVKQVTAIPMSALKGENVVYDGKASMPWYEGPTLVEVLELATVRSARPSASVCPCSVSRVRRKLPRLSGDGRGGAVKPGDSVVILPSAWSPMSSRSSPSTSSQRGCCRDAITLVLDRQVDVARGDMIATIDAQPQVGLAFDAQLVALQPGGIEPGKRYWLKSGSRRQRVTVQPSSLLDLKSGKWNRHDGALPMNAIGKVHLSFDEAAIFDAYELNRTTAPSSSSIRTPTTRWPAA